MARRARIELSEAGGAPPAGWRRIEAELPLFGETLHVAADVEDRRGRLADVVPLARALCDRVVAAAIRRSEALGKPVSCRKGCGACCGKYIVSMTVPEGFRLIEDISRLPASVRDEVAGGFAEACTRIARSGIHEALARPAGEADLSPDEQLRVMDEWWAREGFPCPLLVEQACSQYAIRPLKCREFLVTSDPALCGTPSAERVPLPLSVSEALALWAGRIERTQPTQEMFFNLLAWYPPKQARAERTWRAVEMVRGFLDVARELAGAAAPPAAGP